MRYRIWPLLFKLPFLRGKGGFVLGRLLVFKSEKSKAALWDHEMVHQKQMNELGILRFYLAYGFESLRCLFKFRSFRKAYRENKFEKEAYGDS